jgi:glycogen debranching enzyme
VPPAVGARLAREVWYDKALAQRLEQRAADLRARFRRDFWIEERGCHALALDGNKRRADSLTSNIGHLLWSGILDDGEAPAAAERLLDEQLYSGWGVRTLGVSGIRSQKDGSSCQSWTDAALATTSFPFWELTSSPSEDFGGGTPRVIPV